MSDPRELMSRVWAPIRAIVLVVAVGGVLGLPNCVRAEDELQKALSEAGRIWYEKYCMPCHGPGGAPGSSVYPDSKQPVDLRTYVQRHGGKFPAGEWIAVITGAQPGRVHSEVWEKIRRGHAASGPSGNIEARGIVAAIAEYVISVQTK
jgi:hypothetical protein